LVLAGARIAAAASLAIAGRDVKHRDRRFVGTRHGDRYLGAASGDVGAVDGDQNVELLPGLLFEIAAHVGDHQRTFETERDTSDTFVEFRFARGGLFQADHHQVVALFGFFGDDVGARRFVHDGGHFDLRIGLLVVFLLAFNLLGRGFDRFTGLLGFFLLPLVDLFVLFRVFFFFAFFDIFLVGLFASGHGFVFVLAR